MSYSSKTNHNIRNLLIYNQTLSYLNDLSKNSDQTMNTSIKNKKQDKSSNTFYVKPKYKQNLLNLNDCSIVKAKNTYKLNFSQKILKKIKVFDEINNFNTNLNNNNFNDIDLKTIENFNFNKKRKNMKRYNTFKNLNNNTYMINKPPLKLKNELFQFDKKFMKEISPINKFININKMVNEYRKKHKKKFSNKEKDFYISLNSIREKNNKKKYDHFNSNNFNKKFFTNINIIKNL